MNKAALLTASPPNKGAEMTYFLYDSLGDINNPKLAIIESPPTGLGIYRFTLSQGMPAEPHYPAEATVKLSDDYPGLILSGFVGNLFNTLITLPTVNDIIMAHCPGGRFEILPVTIVNHKNRTHASEYTFLNPLIYHDCLDENACHIDREDEDEPELVGTPILSAAKLVDAPNLFRIPEDPVKILMSEALIDSLNAAGCTNLVVESIPIND